MGSVSGALVVEIKGIGTDQGDQHAYVECVFHDGNRHAIAFGPDIASALCGAFLQASAHLQKKIAIRTTPGIPTNTIPIPIERAEVLIGKAHGKPDRLILSLETKQEAALNFELSDQALSQILNTLKTLGMVGDPPPRA